MPSPFTQGSVAKFDPKLPLAPRVLGEFLALVEKQFPELKGPLAEARAGRYGIAAIEALTSGDQAAAAFFKGLDWYSKGQLTQAVTQLELASGPRREFFPAAFYPGRVVRRRRPRPRRRRRVADNTATGAVTAPIAGSSHVPAYLASIN